MNILIKINQLDNLKGTIKWDEYSRIFNKNIIIIIIHVIFLTKTVYVYWFFLAKVTNLLV